MDSWLIFWQDIELAFKGAAFNAPTKYFFPLIAISMGLCLHFTRNTFRSFYGLAEALFGIYIAIKIAPDQTHFPKNTEIYVALMTASIFLIVRGFDNIQVGITKDPKDIYFARLLKNIKLIK